VTTLKIFKKTFEKKKKNLAKKKFWPKNSFVRKEYWLKKVLAEKNIDHAIETVKESRKNWNFHFDLQLVLEVNLV
jgi:hypothetical protein